MSGAAADQATPLRNSRHEAFAQACLTMSRTDAYRHIYPKSEKWKAASVRRQAYDLYYKVEARVEWLRAQTAKSAVMTHEECCLALSKMIRAVMAECEGEEQPQNTQNTRNEGNGLAYETEYVEGTNDDGGFSTSKKRMRDPVAMMNRLCQMMGYDKPKKIDIRKKAATRKLENVPTDVLVKAVENMAAGRSPKSAAGKHQGI